MRMSLLWIIYMVIKVTHRYAVQVSDTTMLTNASQLVQQKKLRCEKFILLLRIFLKIF